MLPDANLRHQEALDCAKGQKAEADFPFCPRSFDRAVMVAEWYELQLTTQAGDPGSNSALGSQGIVTVWMLTPHYDAFRCSPMLTFDTKKLSTGQKGQKAEANFPFCPRSFDRAVIMMMMLFVLAIIFHVFAIWY